MRGSLPALKQAMRCVTDVPQDVHKTSSMPTKVGGLQMIMRAWSLLGLGACSYLVWCLAGGLICQSTFWLPSGKLAVKVSSHLPEMVGWSKARPFFSNVPLTCSAFIWGLR